MTYRNNQENAVIIENLECIHKSFKDTLGIMSKTRKWAVWQLQGASLGLSHRAVQYQRESQDVLAILMLHRLSSEFLSQVVYFANPNTKIQAIRKWQRVWNPLLGYPATLSELQYSGYKKRPDQHEKSRKLPAGVDFSQGGFNQELNNMLSLWAHPSYDLTRRLFETDKNSGSYERYNFKNIFYSESTADFTTQMIVNNSAAAVHVGSYLYGNVIPYNELLSRK